MKTINLYFAEKNENDVLTLAELAEGVEIQERQDIKVADFDSFTDFISYFRAHYAPVLQRLQDSKTQITEEERRTLSFLASDLLSAFAENNNL